VKVLVFSDIHGDYGALSRLMSTEADYYFAAGDLATWARGLEKCGEIMKPRAERVYVIPGNHESPEQVSSLCERFGFHDFHGRTMRIGRYHVAGLGCSSPTPFDTPGEYSEEELRARLTPFAGLSPLVLICHAPPHESALDQIRPKAHGGSRAIGEFLAENQPDYFFCGHIHEAAGVEERFGNTVAVNVGKRGYLLELK
jgi:Icc-related predicted phosphoesterase